MKEPFKESWGCDQGVLKVCSGATVSTGTITCICDVTSGWARAPDGSCVREGDCQQYFTGNYTLYYDISFSICNI